MRSERQRLGERLRDRLRISSWCLRSTDSATTDRAPPGPASWATVASRCRNRTARSRTAQSYQDRDIVRTLTNFAIRHAQRSRELALRSMSHRTVLSFRPPQIDGVQIGGALDFLVTGWQPVHSENVG